MAENSHPKDLTSPAETRTIRIRSIKTTRTSSGETEGIADILIFRRKISEGSEDIYSSDSEDVDECGDGEGEIISSSSQDRDIDTRNPTDVTDVVNIVFRSPFVTDKDKLFGLWMLFRPYLELDETWHTIRQAAMAGPLAECTLVVRSTTMFYRPSAQGPGPCTSGLVAVYTTFENIDKAGHILINIVKHDIKYKTNQAAVDGAYVWRNGRKPVSMKTLHWNDGNPSYNLEGRLTHGPWCYIPDQWQLNVVTAPTYASEMATSQEYGRWVLTPDYNGMTNLWHFLKLLIESGRLGSVKMVCPPKLNRLNPEEDPVFHVHTACENKEFVGVTLSVVIEKDIWYELDKRAVLASRNNMSKIYHHKVIWQTAPGVPEYVLTLLH